MKGEKTPKAGKISTKTSKNAKDKSKRCYPTRSPTLNKPSLQPSKILPTHEPKRAPSSVPFTANPTITPTRCDNPEDCDYTRPPLPKPSASPVGIVTPMPTTRNPDSGAPSFDPEYCYLLECPRSSRPTID